MSASSPEGFFEPRDYRVVFLIQKIRHFSAMAESVPERIRTSDLPLRSTAHEIISSFKHLL